MNIIKKSQSLSNVVLPLVHIMAEADLSWYEREKVSAAIAACYQQWTQMEKERQTLGQQQASGAQAAQLGNQL